jgi:hypothetical protein
MPNNTEALVTVPFRERKRAYVDALHAELDLNRRFHVSTFVTDFLLNVSALHAAYPKSRRHSHLTQYLERRLAALEADVGAGHWKVHCYHVLRNDYLTGELDWATSHILKESPR